MPLDSGERPGSARTVLLLVGILALAVALRILCYCGCFGSDDSMYAFMANDIARGEFELSKDYSKFGAQGYTVRMGMLLPVALAFRIAGPHDLTMIAYPFLLSLLSVLLAYAGGRMFFSNRVGLIAAALYSLVPIDVRFASMLFPDLIMAFWIGLGVLLLYRSSRCASAGAKATLAGSAGASLAIAWFTKETVVFVVPFMAGYFLWLIYRDRKNASVLLGYICGFGVLFLVEGLVYKAKTGDFFYHFNLIAQQYWRTDDIRIVVRDFYDQYWYDAAEGKIFTVAMARRAFWDGPKAILLDKELGLMTGAAALGLLYAAVRGLRSFVFPGFWFFSLVVVFNFGTTSLKTYRPVDLQPRYLYPMLLPAVLLTAAFVGTLIRSGDGDQSGMRGWCQRLKSDEVARERCFWGILIAGCVVYICLALNAWNYRKGIGSSVERQVATILKPDAKLYTDSRSAFVLRFFWGYPETTNAIDFAYVDAPRIVDGYVLINTARLEQMRKNLGRPYPPFYDKIPKHWSLRWEGRHGKLYWVPFRQPIKALYPGENP